MLLLGVLLLNYWAPPQFGWGVMCVALAVRALSSTKFLQPGGAPLRWFAALLAIGVAGFVRHPAYDAGKDVWYFSKPLVELAFGLYVAERVTARRALRWFLLAGFVVSADYLVRVGTDIAFYVSHDTNANRVHFGPGSFLSLLAVVFVLTPALRREIQERSSAIERSGAWVLVGVALAALLLSRSRTLGLLAGVYAAVRVLSMRRWRVPAMAAGLVLLAGVGLWASGPGFGEAQRLDGSLLMRALQEVAISERATQEEIGANWRGHEGFLALQEFERFNVLEKVFGGGFGQRVTLDQSRQLGGTEFDSVPVLHNGYLFLLVKTGILGVGLFAMALLSLGVRLVSRARGDERLLGFWLIAVLLIATAVISGPFNRTELLPVMVFIGVLLAPRPGWGIAPGSPLPTEQRASGRPSQPRPSGAAAAEA